MSVYLVKGKGWRVDFQLNGERHTDAWFKTKAEARRAEVEYRKELVRGELPPRLDRQAQTQTDTTFMELVNLRLDFLKAYRSEKHYQGYRYYARRWVKRWGQLSCNQIMREDVQKFLLGRAKVARYSANQDLRCLRAMFNWGRKQGLVETNPTEGIEFFPVEKRRKYVPQSEDIAKVVAMADDETKDYLWTIHDTMGRMSEVNRLVWDDIDFENRTVTLYTRKKRGGNLTPRAIPMTNRLYRLLKRRHQLRDKGKPWVFWHRYWSRKEGRWKEGPYIDRKKIMGTLCKKAGVPYFRYHALRHAGASRLDAENVPLGAIQSLLGHENRTTTEIYLHSLGKVEREAVRHLETAAVSSKLGQADTRKTKKSHTDSHTAKRKRLRLVT